jgi:hypothetical protein
MDLYGKKDKSLAQMSVIIILDTLILAASGWILFGDGYHAVFSISDISVSLNQSLGYIFLFIFNCIIYLRMLITIGYLA